MIKIKNGSYLNYFTILIKKTYKNLKLQKSRSEGVYETVIHGVIVIHKDSVISLRWKNDSLAFALFGSKCLYISLFTTYIGCNIDGCPSVHTDTHTNKNKNKNSIFA